MQHDHLSCEERFWQLHFAIETESNILETYWPQ